MQKASLYMDSALPSSLLTGTKRLKPTGPPAKSWSLSFDLAVAIMADFLRRSSSKTVEDLQALSTQKGMPIPSDTLRRKVYITQDYREKAGSILDKLFTEDNERVIGWDWRSDRERVDCLKSEWLENIKHSQQEKPRGRTILYLHGGAYYLGSFGLYRQLLAKLAKVRTNQQKGVRGLTQGFPPKSYQMHAFLPSIID